MRQYRSRCVFAPRRTWRTRGDCFGRSPRTRTTRLKLWRWSADVSAIALDPLIAEAKRRARRRRLWLLVVLAIAAVGGLTYDLRPSGRPGPSNRAASKAAGPRLPVYSVGD